MDGVCAVRHIWPLEAGFEASWSRCLDGMRAQPHNEQSWARMLRVVSVTSEMGASSDERLWERNRTSVMGLVEGLCGC